MSKEKVLITGGAGFIGAHVTNECVKAGYDVVVLDDLSGGFLDHVNAEATFIEGNVCDHEKISNLFSEHRFDYVFHMAAYAAEGLSHFIKRFNYTNNVIGSVNIINECIKQEVKCLVFTSSIAVYGTNQLPMKEDLIPHPEDPYGIAKFTVEKELESSLKMFGLNYIIYRPHNVYGEYQNIGDKYRNVIAIFMNKIMQGEEIPIFGDGEQTRAFSYIGDIAPLMVESLKKKDCTNQVFNIGADKNYSINQIADLLADVMGQKIQKKYYPARNEVVHAYAGHSKIQSIFPNLPTTSIEEGLKIMAQWVQKVGIRKSKDFDNIEITKNLPAYWK